MVTTDPHLKLLTESETAELLGISERTLQAWRVHGGGPAFVRIGRTIRYRRQDVLDWIELNRCTPAVR